MEEEKEEEEDEDEDEMFSDFDKLLRLALRLRCRP
jgi:hypothetical protein